MPFGAFLDAAMNIPKMMHAEEMQNDAQMFNRAEAMEAREFNSAQAVAQRDWTERMSNSAHQRGVADLRKAGLNPILSATQGATHTGSGSGASSGAASSSGTAAQLTSSFSNSIFNSAVKAQRENTDMDTWYKEKLKNRTHSESNTAITDTHLREEQLATQRMLTKRTEAEAEIATSDAKGRALEGNIDETTYGNIMRYINRAIKAITGGSSAYQRMQ